MRVVALVEDVDDAPLEEFAVLLVGVFGAGDEVVHESEGDMECGEAFDGAWDGLVFADLFSDSQLCGFPDIGVEEFDFVASEFLDACASDGGLGLGEEFDD